MYILNVLLDQHFIQKCLCDIESIEIFTVRNVFKQQIEPALILSYTPTCTHTHMQ